MKTCPFCKRETLQDYPNNSISECSLCGWRQYLPKEKEDDDDVDWDEFGIIEYEGEGEDGDCESYEEIPESVYEQAEELVKNALISLGTLSGRAASDAIEIVKNARAFVPCNICVDGVEYNNVKLSTVQIDFDEKYQKHEKVIINGKEFEKRLNRVIYIVLTPDESFLDICLYEFFDSADNDEDSFYKDICHHKIGVGEVLLNIKQIKL